MKVVWSFALANILIKLYVLLLHFIYAGLRNAPNITECNTNRHTQQSAAFGIGADVRDIGESFFKYSLISRRRLPYIILVYCSFFF